MNSPILITVLSAVVIIILFMIISKNSKTSENYDATGMGGRQYWGWGQGYGYSARDQAGLRPTSYQLPPGDKCRPGYSAKINSAHAGNILECVVNDYNYQ
jgi:hypothetical protein